MDEAIIRNKIKAAEQAPPTPADLLERTVLRASCMEKGLAAEARLDEIISRGGAPPEETVASLTAQALLGRISAVLPLPAGSEPDALVKQLEESPKFRAQANRPAEQLLSDVRSGRMLKALTKAETPLSEKADRDPVPHSEKGGVVGF